MVACLKAEAGVPAGEFMKTQGKFDFLPQTFGHDFLLEAVVPGTDEPDLAPCASQMAIADFRNPQDFLEIPLLPFLWPFSAFQRLKPFLPASRQFFELRLQYFLGIGSAPGFQIIVF